MRKRNVAFFLIMMWCMLCGLGCSTDATSDDTTTDDTTTAEIVDLAIGVSSAYVLSDNSDSITVSVSVLDENNAAVSDATVTFSATGGSLSAASATTDESGIAEVTFSAGYADKSNRQVVITAEANDLTAQVPISITGTTVDTTAISTSLVTGGDSDTLTISVEDAGGEPIYNADVVLSVSASSTGSVSLSATSGQTDTSGEFEVTVTGTSAGTATISISAGGATAAQSYSVQASSSALSILSPTSDPASMATDETLTIIVSDPNPGSSNQVVIATTVGTLTYGSSSGSSLTLTVNSNNQVQAALSASEAGTSTITAYDINSPDTTDTITVAIYAPVEEASMLSLQAGSSVVAPSTGALTNSVEITASVVNATSDGVGDAPVVFTLSNTTGGGEYISPVIVYTDASGTATTTFYSGSKSSGGDGVRVDAYLLSDDSISDYTEIVIGGTAGSIGIGKSIKIASAYEDTAYQYPITVLVADSNGNPISNADVSLGLWPIIYLTGNCWTDGEFDYTGYLGAYENEDKNRSTFLDPGEDLDGNDAITPPNSSAGEILSSVTTDENGVATFTLTFLKTYSMYVVVELTASTYVLGSETSSSLNFMLGYAEGDEQYLGDSPFSSTTTATNILSTLDDYF